MYLVVDANGKWLVYDAETLEEAVKQAKELRDEYPDVYDPRVPFHIFEYITEYCYDPRTDEVKEV